MRVPANVLWLLFDGAALMGTEDSEIVALTRACAMGWTVNRYEVTR